MFTEIIIFIIIFIIITSVFYLRTIDEYIINQVEWINGNNISNIKKLIWERAPIIIKDIPVINCWTIADRTLRDHLYSKTDGPENKAIISGAKHWFTKEKLTSIFFPFFQNITAECYAENIGMFMTKSESTCIIPTDNSITIHLLKKSMINNLPNNWEKLDIETITTSDTPFAGDIKYIDIIVKKGMILILPPHWIISITINNLSDGYCIIKYDTPISTLINKMKKLKNLNHFGK